MIPYQTIQDVSMALGRNLTWFETIWFDYSATKSDFCLYCHTILLPSLVISIVPLPLVFVEFTSWFERFKIQPKVKSSFTDMFRCYRYAIMSYLLLVGPLQLLAYSFFQMAGLRSGLPLPSILEIVAQMIVYLLIGDYINYWTHRLLHFKWFYEKIHRIHHEYTTPTAYASTYAHWAEVLMVGTPIILGPLIVPGHIMTLSLWIILFQVIVIEIHMGYVFPWSLTKNIPFCIGPEYHDYHHHYVGGQSHSNLAAMFTYCDYIYGTDKGCKIHKKLLHQQIKEEVDKKGGWKYD